MGLLSGCSMWRWWFTRRLYEGGMICYDEGFGVKKGPCACDYIGSGEGLTPWQEPEGRLGAAIESVTARW